MPTIGSLFASTFSNGLRTSLRGDGVVDDVRGQQGQAATNATLPVDALFGAAAPQLVGADGTRLNPVTGGASLVRVPRAPALPAGETASDGNDLGALGIDPWSTDAETKAALAEIRKTLGLGDDDELSPDAVGKAVAGRGEDARSALRALELSPGQTATSPETAAALKQFQEAAGLPATGVLDLETLMALVDAANRRSNAARPTGGASGGASGGSGGMGAQSGASGADSMSPSGAASGGALQDFAGRRSPSSSSGSAAITGTPGAAPSGTLKQNQKEAYDAALKEGLSPTAAKALVANMTGESLANPRDHHWDVHHMSQGICQWDPQRAAAIQRQFGKLPKDMTVAEQTRAAIWEMKNKYPKTYAALQGNNPQQMVSTLVRDFERPANPSAEIARRLGHYNRLGHLDGAAGNT